MLVFLKLHHAFIVHWNDDTTRQKRLPIKFIKWAKKSYAPPNKSSQHCISPIITKNMRCGVMHSCAVYLWIVRFGECYQHKKKIIIIESLWYTMHGRCVKCMVFYDFIKTYTERISHGRRHPNTHFNLETCQFGCVCVQLIKVIIMKLFECVVAASSSMLAIKMSWIVLCSLWVSCWLHFRFFTSTKLDLGIKIGKIKIRNNMDKLIVFKFLCVIQSLAVFCENAFENHRIVITVILLLVVRTFDNKC